MESRNSLIQREEFSLDCRWMITVQTPQAALDDLIAAIDKNIPLIQGAYSHCMFVRRNGSVRFKNEEGAHGGAEDVVRDVPSAEIVLLVPYDTESLNHAIENIVRAHVHEEPTISVTQSWSYLSGTLKDEDNPNRYWNRTDAKELHGCATKKF